MTVKLASVGNGGERENGRITWTTFARPSTRGRFMTRLIKSKLKLHPSKARTFIVSFTQGLTEGFVLLHQKTNGIYYIPWALGKRKYPFVHNQTMNITCMKRRVNANVQSSALFGKWGPTTNTWAFLSFCQNRGGEF